MQDNYWLMLMLGCLVVLFIASLVAFVNTPKFKPYLEHFILFVLKPFLKEKIIYFIAEIENKMNDEQIEHCGVQKMTEVVNLVVQKLPPPFRNYISKESVERLCQRVYDTIQDILPEICKRLRDDQ